MRESEGEGKKERVICAVEPTEWMNNSLFNWEKIRFRLNVSQLSSPFFSLSLYYSLTLFHFLSSLLPLTLFLSFFKRERSRPKQGDQRIRGWKRKRERKEMEERERESRAKKERRKREKKEEKKMKSDWLDFKWRKQKESKWSVLQVQVMTFVLSVLSSSFSLNFQSVFSSRSFLSLSKKNTGIRFFLSFLFLSVSARKSFS